jgi:hypothetical protein
VVSFLENQIQEIPCTLDLGVNRRILGFFSFEKSNPFSQFFSVFLHFFTDSNPRKTEKGVQKKSKGYVSSGVAAQIPLYTAKPQKGILPTTVSLTTSPMTQHESQADSQPRVESPD